jgi:hypothetical protein
MKKLLCIAAASMLAAQAHAGNKILYYFNHNVDNSVSTGVNAVDLNGHVHDTLAAYIGRAKYTIDVAVYNYLDYSPVGPTIAAAVNAAYARGVKIRWIKDGSSSNTGTALVNSAIPKLSSPTTSAYTIMHNKFMVIDANSSDPNDAVVWTGSTNWSAQQFNSDYNNIVVIQDSALAHAYRGEFNMMWGDTGMTYNTSTSKFGQYKTDLGRHNFTIEGKQVELYFSPSDHTNNRISATINSANSDLYFAMYTFTENTDGSSIVARKNAGVFVAGIVDENTVTTTGGEYTTLNASLTGTNLKVYNGGTYLYHNKYMIVDPECSDPMVLTGSHNWSSSADTKNDENTLIIHNDTAANIYYQSFKADFATFGGALPDLGGCNTAVQQTINNNTVVNVLPNPSTGTFNIDYTLTQPSTISWVLYDMTGREVLRQAERNMKAGSHTQQLTIDNAGMYILKVNVDGTSQTQKLLIAK